jgi:hypothetical protein
VIGDWWRPVGRKPRPHRYAKRCGRDSARCWCGFPVDEIAPVLSCGVWGGSSHDAPEITTPGLALFLRGFSPYRQTAGASDIGAGSGGPPNSFMVHKEIDVTVRSTLGKSRIRESSSRSDGADSTLIFNR